MKANADFSLPVPFLVKFWFSSYGPKCCWPIKLQESLTCTISRKKWMMKYIISIQVNTNAFCKLILPFGMCVAKHAQSTWNEKFAKFLQYLKETVNYEVDLLAANKHQIILQINTIIFCVCGQACPNFPK